MNRQMLKRFLILNFPYCIIGLFSTKLGQAIRLSGGTDLTETLLNLGAGFSAAFLSPLPSLFPFDVLVGTLVALILRLFVYAKSKNAKKYRKNEEYGSARWGTPKDIAPYVDPDFQNNVLLTQTERLTMNSRPKDRKTARNKNVMVVGGSGSGKTFYFVTPNLLQMHSSYVLTDPKGSL